MEREWSSELPISPGIYLWKGVRNNKVWAVVVYLNPVTGKLVVDGSSFSLGVEMKQGIWYGPIPTPPVEKRHREARPRG